MDKNAIKKYAVWARRELISRVSQKAAQYEITVDGYGDQNAASVHGRILTADEKKQRFALIAQIKEKGFEQVMEEIAYTWFNRFSALRFMEVNGYLPTRVRVFTDDENSFKPQILTEAINMELDGLDMQKVYDLKNANDDDALFKYMIIVQCNALSKILPGMFQQISDYTELLFPDNLLREGSIVEQMVTMIPQEDWTDQVQIIGWLYESYNTELNAIVYDGNFSKEKVPKELLPAATTIYTPDWPIRYMVENSLGRLWLEGHPNDDLKASWKYYLNEAEQESDVQVQLAKIRKEYSTLKPEDIRAIDPCQGSGHILAYMFDVLIQIYEVYGYSAREAASSIVKHNIWGLDIDDRAAQLAYFSVMMKARQYDRRFFSRGIQPHVYAIQESNSLDPHCIDYFVDSRPELKLAMDTLVKELHDAKEYGSILKVSQVDYEVLHARFDEIQKEAVPSLYSYQVIEELMPFVNVAMTMAQKYDVVVTNPPYLGSARFSAALSKYVNSIYSVEKADLSMVMFRKAISSFVKKNGFVSFITTSSWMFIKSFIKAREYIISNTSFESIVDFGTELFEGKVGHNAIAAWVCRKTVLKKRISAVRLVDYCYSRRNEKETEFFKEYNRFYPSQENFKQIQGAPIAYWVSDRFVNTFSRGISLQTLINGVASGNKTANNEKYIRLWFEVSSLSKKWKLLSKGGAYRKWYGNWENVIDWSEEAKSFYKSNATSNLMKDELCFKPGITWSDVTIKAFSCRELPESATCETVGPGLLIDNENNRNYLMGILNSKYAASVFKFFNPGLHFKTGDVLRVPIIIDDKREPEVCKLVKRCISITRADYDTYELSPWFKKHPLIQDVRMIEDAYTNWVNECRSRRQELINKETEINRIVTEIYNLTDEIDPTVNDEDITLCYPDRTSSIKSFISYSVGCMLGRYDLDRDGVYYDGGNWKSEKKWSFTPDKDGIIPISSDEYFKDDIVVSFVKFVETVYGKEYLEENLTFIANSLGGRGSTRQIIRTYFLNDFYKDHCAMYSVASSGRRPIYWLFDSGKNNGFKCLIYMHRYQPDTIARIRTDYVHEQQSRYRTAIADLESRVANAGTGERVKLTKQLNEIRAKAEELRMYEEKIHHLADQMIRIDLDDGVKVNYAKFQDVLAKIK